MVNDNADTTTALKTSGVGSGVQQSAQTSPVGGPSDSILEALACVTCRSRKLKCDRKKPVCTRCAAAGGECVYPESRRKPNFKRRNVKELEERLAQVEGLIRNVTNQSLGPDNHGASDDVGATVGLDRMSAAASMDGPPEETVSGSEQASYSFGFVSRESASEKASPIEAVPAPERATSSKRPHSPQSFDAPRAGGGGIGGFTDDLIDLGRFEGLPPFEMIEELHRLFFQFQPKIVPVVHQGNYMRAFYSPMHMRPPMCLQYAIWANAAKGHPMYDRYYDVFYHRARQYLEADELKGLGEHFITLHHAHALIITAINEARSMLFTRAAMTAARCARLVHMLGLQRLDDPLEDEEGSDGPVLAPAKSWAELEERRRTFWGAYCVNVHVTMNTGWPILIDVKDTTTHLPASEDAFNTGLQEDSPTLQEAFAGSAYSSFASTVVISYLFHELLNHVHRPKVSDRPDDLQNGPYWNRHRELDNNLSNAFMFLPEKFRLPTNITDTVALQVNLNLHASVVCLHSAACHAVKKYGLDKRLGERSKERRLNAAREVVKIMRLVRETTSPYKTPLVALSLYCASTVYIDLAKEAFSSPSPVSLPPWLAPELEFLNECMETIGRQHVVTRAYLNQLLLDIEQSDVGAYFNLPNIKRYGCCNHGIPLLVRTAVSMYTKNAGRPLVPRMIPMGGGEGRIIPEGVSGGGGCAVGATAAKACGGSLNENGGAAAAGVGSPPESEPGACSGGTQCPSKPTNDTVTNDGSGSGMAPETKRRRVHEEPSSYVERIDLSDLFKFGSSALPPQHQLYQPAQPVTHNLTIENGDEFNDGWGPGPATAVGPPHLMTPSNETSRPVVQLPHRTINDSFTGMFASNTTGTGLGPSSISDFDPNHIPLEDIANMDLFSNITGMDGIDLDLTNVVVDPLFLSTGNGNGNGNDESQITAGGLGVRGHDANVWMLLHADMGSSGTGTGTATATGTTTGEDSTGAGTGNWNSVL